MTAETASNTSTPRLRRNVLDLPQVVFQGITHIAPSINIVFTFPIIALKAGPGAHARPVALGGRQRHVPSVPRRPVPDIAG